jgi:hypothetical protein
MSKFYKTVTFWENVKRTFATFGGPSVMALHEFGAADKWVIAAGVFSFMGAIVSIWFTDNDKDGTVDLFQ